MNVFDRATPFVHDNDKQEASLLIIIILAQ